MKIHVLKAYTLITAICCFLIVSCTMNTGKTEETDTQGKEYTSTYICPMHCKGSGSDSPGICPVCGMDLVENSELTNEEESIETQEQKFLCPMHPDFTGNQGDTCIHCGMELKLMEQEHEDLDDDHEDHNDHSHNH